MEVMDPSPTVGEPVEGDGVGLSIAVGVLYDSRLSECNHAKDVHTSTLSRVGSLAPNAAAEPGHEANRANNLNSKIIR